MAFDDLKQPRLHLSPPHLTGNEQKLVGEAFASGWIAPLGPHVDEFERRFAEAVGSRHAVALSSGTAAIHLGLLAADIGAGDEVLVSSLTFAASANPVRYVGAEPVFIDSEALSWNMDPALLDEAIRARRAAGARVKAVILVHLYGQAANVAAIETVCRQHGVQLLEDAAEALGATYHDKKPGAFGRWGAFSFNGNKIITTSGGGMLVSDDARLAQQVRKLATQAREPAAHYEHAQVGYNYRLSNILAALGIGQLATLEERVATRRRIYERYREELGHLPGITFQPEAPWGRHSRWLTVITVDPEDFGADREEIRLALEEDNIESRPVWKPMHCQPVYAGCPVFGGAVAERVFERGLCLPSGSSLSSEDQSRVIEGVHAVHAAAVGARRSGSRR